MTQTVTSKIKSMIKQLVCITLLLALVFADSTTFLVSMTADNTFSPSELTINVYDSIQFVGLNGYNVRQVISFDDLTTGPITSGAIGSVMFYKQYFSQQLLNTYTTTTFYFISENYPDTARLKVNVLTSAQVAQNVTRSPNTISYPFQASSGSKISMGIITLAAIAMLLL